MFDEEWKIAADLKAKGNCRMGSEVLKKLVDLTISMEGVKEDGRCPSVQMENSLLRRGAQEQADMIESSITPIIRRKGSGRTCEWLEGASEGCFGDNDLIPGGEHEDDFTTPQSS